MESDTEHTHEKLGSHKASNAIENSVVLLATEDLDTVWINILDIEADVTMETDHNQARGKIKSTVVQRKEQ